MKYRIKYLGRTGYFAQFKSSWLFCWKTIEQESMSIEVNGEKKIEKVFPPKYV